MALQHSGPEPGSDAEALREAAETLAAAIREAGNEIASALNGVAMAIEALASVISG